MSNNPDDSNQQNFGSFGSFGSFGQFNQANTSNPSTLNTHWGFAPPAEAPVTPEPENKEASPTGESQTATASISSNFDAFINSPQVESKATVDSDSFLAEPSMTAAEFDSTFVKEAEPVEQDHAVEKLEQLEQIEQEKAEHVSLVQEPEVVEPSPEPEVVFPAEPVETISMTSPDTIPQLIEEPEKTSQYLESPQSSLIEDAAADSAFPDLDEVNESDFEVVESAELAAAVLEPVAAAPVEIPETPKPKKAASIAQTPKAKAEPKVETPKAALAETPKSKETPKVKETPQPKVKETPLPKAKETPLPKVTKPKSPAKSPVKKSEATPVEGTRHSTRQRTTVQRLEAVPVTPKKESAAEIVIQKGSGVRLGDIESVAKAVNGKVAANPQLIVLHRVLFDRMGEASKRKANIRAFCGVEGAEGDAVKALEAKLQKYTATELKNLAILLCLASSGDKASLCARIAAFLTKPSADACVKTATKKATKPAPKPKHTNRTAALKRKNSQESITAQPATAPKKAKTVAKAKDPAKSKKSTQPTEVKSFLTPETVESDVDSDVEREVLEEIKNSGTP